MFGYKKLACNLVKDLNVQLPKLAMWGIPLTLTGNFFIVIFLTNKFPRIF